MLWALTILLLFLWVLGVATSTQVGAWIHILLVLAVVSLVVNLVRGRSVV
ncbi:MAG: lmo0937 family membrane protein [Polyangiales bacterium]